MINFTSPSYMKNRKTEFYALNGIKCLLWYLGIRKITKNMIKTLEKSQHLLLIEDKNLREKYLDCLSTDLIPESYKNNENDNLKKLANETLSEQSFLKRNKKFAQIAMKLFDKELSPALIDDEMIKKFPDTYFIICENDEFKDENFVFAERLRINNVNVTVSFCEEGYHGMITDITDGYLNTNSVKLVDDMVNYIKMKTQ